MSEANQYLLRAPFSLQKITWNPDTKTVIYRSRRSWHTKRNFEVFKATDFLAAAIEHIPPKGQQTIRYYGLYSNKSRGITRPIATIVPAPPEPSSPDLKSPISNLESEVPLIPAPPKTTARAMRPLWRDLILSVWGSDPLKCPCCQGTMRRVETILRPGEVEFFLRLLSLWEPERSGDRLPTGSPKGGASATSTHHQSSATPRAAFRYRKTPRDRRRFGRRRKPEPAGRARQVGRANQTFEPIEPPWQAIRV